MPCGYLLDLCTASPLALPPKTLLLVRSNIKAIGKMVCVCVCVSHQSVQGVQLETQDIPSILRVLQAIEGSHTNRKE